ncbi:MULTISPECIES: peptidoglycan-binding protein [Leuconostoc]|uniref:Peptidoglycan-binding protein n=1 Tax=Leuconostoc holzapfelii TaxID=434464 RepID=A0A846ZFS5_9LACO|nr:peptidoglycan-binding protein [Leuconostoc holzapfelii]NKZ19054.1 peptidoglycan-binding protein [Leuconostoc holzapfelii]
MMLKKILITSATITGVTLGMLGAQLKAETHPTDAASVNEQVDVKAVDQAVASLADVQSVQLSASKAVAEKTAQAVQPAAPVATPVAEVTPAVKPTVAPAAVTPVAVQAAPAQPVAAAPASGDLQWLISRESSGNVNAQNGAYYGIGQLSAANYARYVPGQDYRGNYAVQLEAMQKYIAERYGSVSQAISHWQANNWY